jgi:hypothetical protein
MVGGLDGFEVIARTLLEEFGYVRAYPNFCVASRAPLHQDQDRRERLLGAFPVDMQASIRDLTEDALDGEALVKATANYPANQDWRPVSEYYLGLELRQWLESGSFR